MRKIWLHRVYLEESGWVCKFVLVTPEVPRTVPRRWGDFNVVHVELGLVDVMELQITGWPRERFAEAAVARSASGFVFEAVGTGVSFKARCSGMHVCSVKGVLAEEEWLSRLRAHGETVS
jgi:hypothetical protein